MSRLSEGLTRLRRHEPLRQFVRYALVGCLNAAIFLVIFNLLTPSHASRPRIIGADAVALLITSVISFQLNKWWSFRDTRRGQSGRQYARFLFFTLIGLGLQL